MSYERTFPVSGMGDTASTVAGAAGGAASSIVGAYYDIQGMRQQRRAGASSAAGSISQFLDETLYGRQAEQMAQEETSAQQAVDRATSTALSRTESEIERQTAILRGEQARQQINARIGTQLGRGRAFPWWAWTAIGTGVVGLVLAGVWLMARRG